MSNCKIPVVIIEYTIMTLDKEFDMIVTQNKIIKISIIFKTVFSDKKTHVIITLFSFSALVVGFISIVLRIVVNK